MVLRFLKFLSIFFLFILSFYTTKAFSLSCCGSSPVNYYIPEDHQDLNFTLGYSNVHAVGRVFQDTKNFIKWTDKERLLNIIHFSASYKVKEKLSLSLQNAYYYSTYKDSSLDQVDENFGDTLLSINYEPNIYKIKSSPFKNSRVYTSALVNFPTGRSIFENRILPEAANVTGHDLWGLGAGLTVLKRIKNYNLDLQTKILNIFSDRINNQFISSYYDISISLMLSKSFSFFSTQSPTWQISTGLNWSYVSKRKRRGFEVVGENLSALSNQKTAAFFKLRKSFDDFNFILSYSDETLLGRPRNTIINRTFLINLSKNI